MADNKKWFKVWTSILADPDLWTLSLEDIGRWAMLGALTALHGDNGILTTSKKALGTFIRSNGTELENSLIALQNVSIEYVKNSNGTFTVTFLNWQKYQEDSTVAERQKRFREKKRNGLRREEKRGEEKRNNPYSPQELFERFWKAYPKKKSKGDAEKAWLKILPSEQLLETMVSTIEIAKTSEDWTKEKGQYIPYPASWLNAKGWLDEYTPANETQSKKSSTRPCSKCGSTSYSAIFEGVCFKCTKEASESKTTTKQP